MASPETEKENKEGDPDPRDQVTICYILEDEEILLGWKKRLSLIHI